VLFDLDYLENCCPLEETVQITGSKTFKQITKEIINCSTLLSPGPQKLKMRFPNDIYADAERRHIYNVTLVLVFHSVTLV